MSCTAPFSTMKQSKCRFLFTGHYSNLILLVEILLPCHDMQAIACTITHAYQENGVCARNERAVWADIACPKFSIARPKFILIDTTELILN